jgi:hypothetical protein
MKISLILLTCALLTPLHAEVALAPLFADGAVLQRDKPVPVWGTAGAGEKITVTFAGQTLATTADGDGRWRVNLAALPASATPGEMVVKAANTLTVRTAVVVTSPAVADPVAVRDAFRNALVAGPHQRRRPALRTFPHRHLAGPKENQSSPTHPRVMSRLFKYPSSNLR